MDILSSSAYEDTLLNKSEGFEGVIRHSLGLTDLRPIPEPAEFAERDPLGERVASSTSQDYIAQLGKHFIYTYIQLMFFFNTE